MATHTFLKKYWNDPHLYTSALAQLRRADNEESSYKKRSILNIERVYVAPIFLFGLFYVNTLKEENIFKLIHNIPTFFDFLFSALFTVMLI